MSADVRTIIDTDAASLWYHPSTRIVHHELRTFVHGTLFRQILERGLEVFIQEGAHKWLSDDRGNGPLTKADTEWALENWAPRVMAAGWKYWAIVMPQKVLGEMNMRRWAETYAALGVTVRAFSQPDSAMAWLEAPESFPAPVYDEFTGVSRDAPFPRATFDMGDAVPLRR